MRRRNKLSQPDTLDLRMITQHLLGNVSPEELDQYIINRRRYYERVT